MASSSTRSKMFGIIPTTFVLFFLSFFSHVYSLGTTDTITWGGDNSRTGYQTNHNMDPSIVGSAQFGQLFKTTLPGLYNGVAEQVFSQPLLYTTTSDNIQYIYVATTQNNLYKLDAKTGVIIAKRNLHIPFLAADLNGCVDINPHVGVTATGVIDPDTETLYLTSKTYADQTGGNGPQGKPNGRYYFHAINVNDLSDRPNFPVDLEGTVASNNPIRSFNGGIHHQRPALLHTGQYIYAGFASHCVQYNFTGWIMGWDKTTGAIVERMATEGAGVPNTTPGGGVWMSGGGLTSDDAGSMFFATGNGYASQLSTIPVNGHNPPTALEEAAVHMTINSDGSLTIVDFFMPWEKTQLDGADRDLGTTPLEMLPSQFSCGDVKRIGVVTGKSGKTYWLNLDDLGGYQNGPNKLDDIIQVYQNENSVYAGAGVYPLEGGYIYVNIVNHPTRVFQFSCVSGVPSFAAVATTATSNGFGVGHGTVTSLNGQVGTGLLWTSDLVGLNLRIYNAVPVNGGMTMINSFNVPGLTKFTRPVFGDGRVYLGTTLGYFYGFGAPVNLPLNCSSPYDFGTANLDTPTASKVVTCTANIAVTVSNITLTGDPNFNITGLPAVPLTVAAGKSFSFNAYFNAQAVGPQSSDVVVGTTNGVTGYSVTTPIGLRGTGQSVAALLAVSPVTVAFPGYVTGQQIGGVNQTVIFANQGNSPLTISSIQYSLISETGPFIPSNGTASAPEAGPFTFIGLPSTIPGNSAVSVTINFDTSTSGNFGAYLTVNSNGGSKVFDVVGTSGSAPQAVLEFQTTDGSGWVQYKSGTNYTFGNVTENTTRSLKLRLTNNATVDGASLSITVSKPPFGVAGSIIGTNNNVDLGEGTSIPPGANVTATMYCSVPKEQWNTNLYYGYAQWTMNTNDLVFDKQFIQFACTAVSEQAPPLLKNGYGKYRYTGCYKENNPGRQLATLLYGSDTNTNAMCIAACAAGNYIFCGTQYNRECWAGPTIPILQVDDGNCNYPCSGDINEICGGNGVGAGAGGAYISLFADSTQFNGNTTSPSSPTSSTSSSSPTSPANPLGPYTNPGVLGYTSIGCYTEGTNSRALPNGKTMTSSTVAVCVAACSASNYIYAGLEYGQECWCGNSFAAGAVPTAITDCSTPCANNVTEYCGAGQRLNVYEANSALSSSSSSSGAPTSSKTSTLLSSSSSSSSSKAPVSSKTSTSVSSSSSVSSTPVSSPSSSTGSTSGTSSTGTVSTSVSSTSFSSSAPTQTGPAIEYTIGKWVYQGCWTESTTGRALSSTTFANDSMTLEACAAFCRGFSMFGVEYGRECYCGNTLNAGSVNATLQSDCNFLCPGNNLEYCGAGQRLELYSLMPTSASTSSASSTTSTILSTTSVSSTSSIPIKAVTSTTSSVSSSTSSKSTPLSTSTKSSTTSLVPSSTSTSTLKSSSSTTTSTLAAYTGPPVASNGNVNFTTYGCVSEPSAGRLLSSQVDNNGTAMTIEKCLGECWMYAYAGVEYGRECWCGNTLDTAGNTGATPSANLTETTPGSQCGFICPGNSSEYCGSGEKLSLFWFDTVKAKANKGG